MDNEERIHKALDLITECGGFDGAHHKQWLLDQLVHILAQDYTKWVSDYEGPDGEYEWDVGIPP